LNVKAQEYGSEEAYKADLNIKYGNTIEGMSESGVAAFMRKLNTDFGSPYQGMGYSSSVLEDHNLRRERQNYINRQFMLRHFSEEGDIGLFFKKHIDSAFRKQYGFSIEQPSLVTMGNPVNPERYSSLKGKNLIEYSIDPTQITVEDADTITVNRDGGIIDPLNKFMGTTGQAKFRLAGIDAPETAHEYRAAQPYAEAAKRIAQELLANAKEVKVVTEPGDMTYGRQVGVVYVDGKNLNLELLKRGAAAYLPYKGKGKQPIYDQKAFEIAEEQAYEAKKGMWSEAYFQAYKEITKVSGQTVTFNMLNDPAKVVNSSNMMSMFAEMNKAQRQGYINKEELEILGKKIGSLEKPFADDPKFSAMNLETYGQPSNSITSVLDQQKYEIGRLMRTRGSDRLTEKMKVGNVNQNNVEMAKLITSDSVYESEMNQKSTEAKIREIESFKRKQTMAAMQQSALRNQFNSPIGHHRM
jgi:micrococcal nuclease